MWSKWQLRCKICVRGRTGCLGALCYSCGSGTLSLPHFFFFSHFHFPSFPPIVSPLRKVDKCMVKVNVWSHCRALLYLWICYLILSLLKLTSRNGSIIFLQPKRNVINTLKAAFWFRCELSSQRHVETGASLMRPFVVRYSLCLDLCTLCEGESSCRYDPVQKLPCDHRGSL